MSAAELGSENNQLPKPLVVNGRFQNSWENPGRPGFWEVLKFLTVVKSESNIPSQKV